MWNRDLKKEKEKIMWIFNQRCLIRISCYNPSEYSSSVSVCLGFVAHFQSERHGLAGWFSLHVTPALTFVSKEFQ